MNLKQALRTLVAVAALSAIATPAFAQESAGPMITVEQCVPVVATPPRAEAEVRAGKIFVTLDSPSDVVLERQSGSEWVTVCTGTCGEMLPLDGYYRVNGSGIRDSKPFRLEGAPGDRLTISASTGSAAAYDAGIVLTVTGGLGLATAGWILYYELLNSIDDHYGDAQKGTTFGLELGVASAIVTTIGIVFIAGNPPSTTTQHVGGRAATAAASPPAPTWHTRDFRGLPSASTVPIFSSTF